MKASGVLLLTTFILPLLFTVHHGEAVEANNTSSVEGSIGTKIAPPDSAKAGEEKRAKVQDGAAQGETGRENERNDTKENPNTPVDKTLVEPKVDGGKGKGRSDSGSESRRAHKEDSGVEECDLSNRCIDEKNKFIACLRVPGKDSLDLSLLIQNKGTGSLDVNIVAPKFVNLEQATVQLQTKENKEVRVSVSDVANDTVIVLKAGEEGTCSIDFQNMIASASIRKSEPSTLSRYIKIPSRAYLICAFLASAVLVGGAAWLCIRFRRMHHQEGGPGYQKVEMGLPVSSGGKKEADEVDGWDNNWGEGWDDEEAPTTPSNPILNPSSKGLASRRSNRDGWKD